MEQAQKIHQKWNAIKTDKLWFDEGEWRSRFSYGGGKVGTQVRTIKRRTDTTQMTKSRQEKKDRTQE